MKLKNWVICVLIGGVTLLSACARLEKYLTQHINQEIRDQQQADEVAADLRRLIAEEIVTARILVNAYPYEGLFVMPTKELAQLKNILSRMEAIPPARGEPVVVYVSYPAVDTLVLVDKDGGTYDFPVMMKQWMKKSEAALLQLSRPQRSDEARWCLPDEDYAAMEALPTVRQARAWAKLHSRGTALVIPNKRTAPVQSPAAAPAAPEASALAASSTGGAAPAAQQPPTAPSAAVSTPAPAAPLAASGGVLSTAAKPVAKSTARSAPSAAAKPTVAKPEAKPAAPSAIEAILAPVVPEPVITPVMPESMEMPSLALPM